MNAFRNFRHYGTFVFNTIFAFVSSLTLIMIVIKTRPQQEMHNIAPHWWLPLTLIMVPTQIAAQCLSWKTICLHQVPSPPIIARNQPPIPSILRPAVALFWAAGFFMWFALLVQAYNAPVPPTTGSGMRLALFCQVTIITCAFATLANVFLMLLARTATDNEESIELVWRFRYVVDALIAMVAVAYDRIAS